MNDTKYINTQFFLSRVSSMISTLILLKITSIMSAGFSVSAAMMGLQVGQTEPNLEAYITTSTSTKTNQPETILKYRGVEYRRSIH